MNRWEKKRMFLAKHAKFAKEDEELKLKQSREAVALSESDPVLP
jgi:hypothetical protein